MKIALVHDWLVTYSGAEKVFSAIHEMYKGEVFTLFGTRFPTKVTTSFLGKFPYIERYYRNLFPWYPYAVKRLDLHGFDLILSSSFCMAKNISKTPSQIYICYCHTPARYLWDLNEEYKKALPLYKRALFAWSARRARAFDLKQTKNVDLFMANSGFVKERIRHCYGRSSIVVYPPVDTDFFTPSYETKGSFFITCSRLVPYKKTALLVEAFRDLPKQQLIIIGEGPERKKLEKKAPSNVTFYGKVSDLGLRDLYRRAQAFVYAAVEDFGIVLAEAISCGCPVIAYGQGGAREIVREDCGILFHQRSPRGLLLAIDRFMHEQEKFDPEAMHEYAKRFSYERFQKEYQSIVDSYLDLSRR